MSKLYIPIVLTFLLGLGACSYTGAALGVAEEKGLTAVQQKRQYNDLQAEVLKNAPCETTIGSYHRVLNDLEKQAVDVLCGGDLEAHVTAEDVQKITGFLELLDRSKEAINDGVPE